MFWKSEKYVKYVFLNTGQDLWL